MPPKNTAVGPPKKKKPTPLANMTQSQWVSRLTSAVRRASMYHPIFKAATKKAGNACEECGKTTKEGAKLEVHHRDGVTLYRRMKIIAEVMFPPIEDLDCICQECHKLRHRKDK